jgi:AraC-like DNA-binding protein
MLERIRFHRFPVAGVDAMTATTARSFPRHTHDQYGFGVIDSGGHASLSGRGQVEAGPGNLIFVNPGEVHDGRAIRGRPRSWRMLYVNTSLMERARADVLENADGSLTFSAPVFTDAQLRTLFDIAFRHASSTVEAGDAMACETAILRLVARLAINTTAAQAPAPQNGKVPAATIRRARERIDADPSARLTLTELASEVGLSRYQLLRGFARQLGLTPHAYILQKRIALARRLIRGGHVLAEAAALAGFCDQSHLTRCFVRQFGVTPSRYASRAT